MDFGHAARFATEQARQLAGDFYPGPVLMPYGLLRAMDPILAVALGPGRLRTEAFQAAMERMLRGRPDGPLLLALWSSAAAGEISHDDLRSLGRLLADAPPDPPASRGELLGFLHPRVSVVARCMLSVAKRNHAEALAPAERLGCAIVLTRILADLPRHLAAGRMPLPLADLEKCGLELEELRGGVRTPGVDRFLATECLWVRELLDQALPIRRHLSARLRRGVRAVVVRTRTLLDQIEDPQRDLFRRPVALSRWARWRCAGRALLGISEQVRLEPVWEHAARA